MQPVDVDAPALARWRNAIIVAFAIGGVSLTAWGPRLPELRADLGVDVGTIGVMLAGVTVGSVAGLLGAAPLLRRLGGRRALTLVVVVVPAAVALVGIAVAAHSAPLATVGFVVAGAGIGSLDVMANVEGTAIEVRAGRTLLPLMHAAWSGGAALGAGVAALCAWLGVTPTQQLLGQAAIILVVGVLAVRAVPDGSRAEEPDTTLTPGQRLRRWARGWTDVRLLLIGVVMLGVELGEGSANNWLALATTDGHGGTPAVGALFFTVFAVSEAVTRVAAGPVVDRLGRVRTVRVTTALGIVGAVLFILGPSSWVTLPRGRPVGGRGLHGLPARHVRRGAERCGPCGSGERRRVHRVLRQLRRPAPGRCGRRARGSADRAVARRGPLRRGVRGGGLAAPGRARLSRRRRPCSARGWTCRARGRTSRGWGCVSRVGGVSRVRRRLARG
ncbi:MFS transporter [Curtobacterium sp. 1P10AnD]|uniref:MFS transporter n=1 Tax=Curtobacterium sp. 1P10AnD TaxID=3132283 RepID=UPI0039A1F4A0